MPTTKTLTIKTEKNLRNALKYILASEKTNNQTLISGYNIHAVNNAFFEMKLTRMLARNILGESNKKTDQEVIARHIIQSFDPNDQLTPERIHEIGRQTAIEFLGGEHEFVIATHVDKEHIHNHIIFNTTSSVNLKKFRWQRGTAAQLRNFSDKVADYYGASVLDQAKRNSYTAYQEYRRKNAYRTEIKERLNFLLKHSTSWDDFLKKAKLLQLSVDSNHQSKEYGQVINYQLLDKEQKRPARNYTLNQKHRIYNKESIIERISKNDPKIVYHLEEVAEKYNEYKQEKESLPDLKVIIEPWQIEKDTLTGIYVEINYGRYEKGVIKIPDYRLEKRKGGGYEAYFNYKDVFYFWSEMDRKKNKFVKGADLAKYICEENGLVPKRKNSAIQNVREMVAALNIVATRRVSKEEAPKVLGKTFQDNFEIVQQARKLLDEKLLKANERLKFDPNNSELLTKVKILRTEKNELEKQIKRLEKQLETYDAAMEILSNKGYIETKELGE
ncbi:relaxase/mobilization nuclease domain-containing protein [Enterococcus faecalis]|uniref:relaxase/mobilization nuclease domain-containing protein n=1 Tax=Enterococcus faecalis TaxID=1351 RepID=UPI0025B1CB2E|nr:relaxase/mobilization nuclease domain-containing protein [Enterococcus faecalis]MDN3202072.1 relaxase/mobilization nuclease domain-containing protein [Enterococcus faecalis]